MKVAAKVLITLIWLGSTGSLAYSESAQAGGGANPNVVAISPEEEAEWVKIRDLKKIYEEALQSNKLDSIAPYLSEHFTATMLSGEEISGLAGLKAYNEKTRQLIGDGATYKLQADHRPGWMSGDVAVAHGSTKETVVTSKNNRFDYQARWSAVLRKENGSWKLFRLHISLDPVGNPFAKFFARKEYQLYLCGAFVAGLVLGFVLRGVVAKKA